MGATSEEKKSSCIFICFYKIVLLLQLDDMFWTRKSTLSNFFYKLVIFQGVSQSDRDSDELDVHHILPLLVLDPGHRLKDKSEGPQDCVHINHKFLQHHRCNNTVSLFDYDDSNWPLLLLKIFTQTFIRKNFHLQDRIKHCLINCEDKFNTLGKIHCWKEHTFLCSHSEIQFLWGRLIAFFMENIGM